MSNLSKRRRKVLIAEIHEHAQGLARQHHREGRNQATQAPSQFQYMNAYQWFNAYQMERRRLADIAADSRETNPDDIALWPDGTWCYMSERSEYTYMSDDYEVVPVETPEWLRLCQPTEVT